MVKGGKDIPIAGKYKHTYFIIHRDLLEYVVENLGNVSKNIFLSLLYLGVSSDKKPKKLKKKDIIDSTGLSRSAVNYGIQELREYRILHVEDKYYAFMNPYELECDEGDT